MCIEGGFYPNLCKAEDGQGLVHRKIVSVLLQILAKRVYDPNFATFWVISTLIFC